VAIYLLLRRGLRFEPCDATARLALVILKSKPQTFNMKKLQNGSRSFRKDYRKKASAAEDEYIWNELQSFHA
jgi:hypothetical protein